MKNNRVKDIYMKARHKILLIAGALSLSIGMGAATHAQEQRTEKSPLVSTHNPPSALDTNNVLKNSFDKNSAQREPVIFIDYESYKELFKLLPEARQIVKEFGEKKEDAFVFPQGQFARISDRLIIFKSDAPDYCGRLGCLTAMFSPGEEGYYPSAIMFVPGPFQFAIDSYGEPSVFVCSSSDEWVEWKRRDSLEMSPLPQEESCLNTQNDAIPAQQPAPKP